jgi:DUF4097 and DUF4098 domain-containing protein YvlB
MKIILNYIFAVFTGLTLLISMSGISIYSHHCEKSGYSKSSVFEEVANCNHAKDQVCKTEHKECCSKYEEIKKEKKDKNCCNTEETQIKLKVEFELLSYHQDIKPILNFVNVAFTDVSNEIFIIKKNTKKEGEVFRPPSGKQLLLLIQNLKTEPNPVG